MRVCELPFEQRAFPNVLREQARHIGNDPFLLFEDKCWSFAEVDRLVDDYAGGLVRLGVEAGTLLGVMMDNGPENLWITLAIIRLGAVFVPINNAYKGGFLSHVLTHSGVTLLIVEDTYVDELLKLDSKPSELRTVIVRGGQARVPGVDVIDLASVPEVGTSPIEYHIGGSGLASILYTSGTTGASKGVMMTHSYWHDATMWMTDKRAVREDDVFFVTSPMFHAAAWSVQIFFGLGLGLPVALDRRFSVSRFWERVAHYKATQLHTMSSQHMWLWNAPAREDDAANSVRVWGAIPLAPELLEAFMKRFGVTHHWSVYGQTEAQNVTHTGTDRPYKPGSAGWSRPQVELAVVDTNDRLLSPGELGELVIRPRTPHTVMEGYWRNPDATLKAFRNLWYHTGDLAYIDQDGELFFKDRRADYIRVRGENISSFEVEAIVGEHPAVAGVASIGVRTGSPDLGEDDLMIWIVLESGAELTHEELARYCDEHLPRFASPRYIEFVSELPLTPTNRVQKDRLRARGVGDATWDRVAAGLEARR